MAVLNISAILLKYPIVVVFSIFHGQNVLIKIRHYSVRIKRCLNIKVRKLPILKIGSTATSVFIVQVNNYEIVVNFFNISHNLT